MKGHLYFIGIVGHAMRGLALATREMGYRVSGLDPGADEGTATAWLAERKIPWKREFSPADMDGVTAVIVTGAHATNEFPAIVEARKRHIPIKSSAQWFGELTKKERVISVAGTHGKTTTTSFITWLLEADGHHPDFLIGVRPFNFDSSVRLTGSDIAVVEGDEYRASMLEMKSKVQYYHPDVLVLTAVEHDHPDMYPDLESVKNRFREVISGLPRSGHLIVCAQSKIALELAESADCPVTTYGLDDGDYQARDIAYHPTGIEMDVLIRGTVLGRLAAPLFGRHNVLNALAAVAAVSGEGLTFDQIIEGAARFKGAYRRFNLLTKADDKIAVIDDYAHHPTEATAMIEAAKLHFPGRRVVVLYRPHTYSRTQALLPEYQRAFDRADVVYITDIEGARETGQEHTVSGNDIVKALKMPAQYMPDRPKLVELVKSESRAGDVVLCLTVSGHGQIAEELAKTLNS